MWWVAVAFANGGPDSWMGPTPTGDARPAQPVRTVLVEEQRIHSAAASGP